MAKKKAPFPIYCVSEFQRAATCDEGADCNPAENPAHHVLIDLTPEARAVVRAALGALQEARSWNAQDLKGIDDITPNADMLRARARVLSPKIARDLCDLLEFAAEGE